MIMPGEPAAVNRKRSVIPIPLPDEPTSPGKLRSRRVPTRTRSPFFCPPSFCPPFFWQKDDGQKDGDLLALYER